MWIVDLALRKPLTFIVLAIFILISGVLCILRTPKDIFPNIDIPVVSVIFNYAGMSPEQMIRKIVPAQQLGEIIDNLGLPYSGINTSYNNTGTVSRQSCRRRYPRVAEGRTRSHE